MTTPDPLCSIGLLAHNINTVATVLYTQKHAAMAYIRVQTLIGKTSNSLYKDKLQLKLLFVLFPVMIKERERLLSV